MVDIWDGSHVPAAMVTILPEAAIRLETTEAVASVQPAVTP